MSTRKTAPKVERESLNLVVQRTLTKDLVIHYKRQMFLIEQTPTTLALRKRKRQVYEQADGTVTLRCGDIPLKFAVFNKTAHVDQGEVVANKLLGGALAHIQEMQIERDKELLASKKLTNREKKRLREVNVVSDNGPSAYRSDDQT